MRMRGWTIHLFEPRADHHQEIDAYRSRPAHQNGVGVLHTDEGIEGVVSTDAGRLAQIARAWPNVAAALADIDVFDRGAIERVLAVRYNWPTDLIGIVDYALWDVAGKALGQPIYKLLGGHRDRVMAYASTVHHATDERFVESALACKEMGFRAIKIHPYCVPDDDMRVCRKVREAVGDDMILMVDTLVYPAPYSRRDAHRMARVLDELDFYWFEDPLPRTDLDGLAELRQACTRVRIRGCDRATDIREYAALIRLGCLDIVAGPASFGITDLMKLAAFAEVHGMTMEPHDFGGGTASLHVLLSISNGNFYEIAVPRGCFDTAIYEGVYRDPCWIDADGMIRAPAKPGLGFEIDFDAARRVTRDTIRV